MASRTARLLLISCAILAMASVFIAVACRPQTPSQKADASPQQVQGTVQKDSEEPQALSATLTDDGTTCLLRIHLKNNRKVPIQVPELKPYTLVLHDKAGEHLGLGSQNACIAKTITLAPGEVTSFTCDLGKTRVRLPDTDIYVTHRQYTAEVPYETQTVKVLRRPVVQPQVPDNAR